jgi:hypothetical protein
LADTTVGKLITDAGSTSLEDAYLRLTEDEIQYRGGR